jgi:hypothetical protein
MSAVGSAGALAPPPIVDASTAVPRPTVAPRSAPVEIRLCLCGVRARVRRLLAVPPRNLSRQHARRLSKNRSSWPTGTRPR